MTDIQILEAAAIARAKRVVAVAKILKPEAKTSTTDVLRLAHDCVSESDLIAGAYLAYLPPLNAELEALKTSTKIALEALRQAQ